MNKLKQKLCFSEFPENSFWKLDVIQELTNVKMGNLTIDSNNEDSFTSDEIDDIINYVTTS